MSKSHSQTCLRLTVRKDKPCAPTSETHLTHATHTCPYTRAELYLMCQTEERRASRQLSQNITKKAERLEFLSLPLVLFTPVVALPAHTHTFRHREEPNQWELGTNSCLPPSLFFLLISLSLRDLPDMNPAVQEPNALATEADEQKQVDCFN